MAVQYRNSCYSLFDDTNGLTDFNTAETKCQSMNGAHLVSIVNTFEYSFLKYYITQNGKADNTGLNSMPQEFRTLMCLNFSSGLTIGPIISPNGTIMSLCLRVRQTRNVCFSLNRTARGEQAIVPLIKHIFVKNQLILYQK